MKMLPQRYELPVLNPTMRRATRGWLMLGLAALVGAGIYSLLLILARTPGVQEIIPLIDFFRVALVVHVDLSVSVWLISMAGMLWCLASTVEHPTWDRVSLALAAAGMAVVFCAPFLGAADPLMNNYIPLLRHPVFYSGMGLIAAGIVSHLVRSVVSVRISWESMSESQALRYGMVLGAVITAIAIASFILSWAGMPGEMSGEVYFEYLFWGGGHVLQFTHTMMMMIAWIMLVQAGGSRFELTPRLTLVFLTVLALPVITVPFFYLAHEIDSPGHRLAFTELMKYGGLSCLPLGIAVLVSAWKSSPRRGDERYEYGYLQAALYTSILLFAVGGVLGFMVSGLDIVIPAHYHGSTVGVTIAFMGVCYYLLPRLGFGRIRPRLAWWQLVIYAGGQLMHIAGLAWTGGYGVQRKTAGLAQGVDRIGEIAGMGLMGLGGLVSVIGGALFLLVCYFSVRSKAATVQE